MSTKYHLGMRIKIDCMICGKKHRTSIVDAQFTPYLIIKNTTCLTCRRIAKAEKIKTRKKND